MDAVQIENQATDYLDSKTVWVEEDNNGKYYLKLLTHEELAFAHIAQRKITILPTLEDVKLRNARSEYSVKPIIDAIERIENNRRSLLQNHGGYRGLQLP